LIGVVLPAATFPLQVVEAARFLDRREDDPNAAPDDDWDDSIVALLNYPQVVDFLNEDLDWTWSLGEAVLNQRADVLDAVQSFRSRARAAGNLQSDNRQIVVENREVIEIRHADPEVIYVPYYEPRRVVVYQSAPVIHYHPWAYPVYYYPYPVGYRFDAGFFFGVTSAFVIGWHDHYIHVHHHRHHLHPYYGFAYYDPFYVRRSININVNVYRDSYVWAPRVRTVGRPVRFSDGRPVTRTVERRVSDGGTTRTVRSDSGRTTRTTERRASAGGAGASVGTSTGTNERSAAAARTRTTERSSAADGARATTRSTTADGVRATTRSAPSTETRTEATNGGSASVQTRTRESAPNANTRIAPSVPSAPAPAAAPRSAPSAPAAPSATQRTRVVEGRPFQGSTATQRSTTTQRAAPTERAPAIQRSAPTQRAAPTQIAPTIQRSAPAPRAQGSVSTPITRSQPRTQSSQPRTQTSQPSAPSRSAQPTQRPSTPSSSAQSASSSSSRTRGGDSGNASSSRSQSSGGSSSSSRTRTR
jgi:hypothetical protein